MKVNFAVKYRIYKRGGVWLVRTEKNDGNGGTKLSAPIGGGYVDIRMAWHRISHDIRRRTRLRVQEQRRVGSRATGGRFHGADC